MRVVHRKRAVAWAIYLALIALFVGYRLQTVWRDSIASLDEQLTRSLSVTRGTVDAWIQRHVAFASVASSLLDADSSALNRFAQTLRSDGHYDAAWVVGDRGVIAAWPAGTEPPAGFRDSAGASPCAPRVCFYIGRRLATADGTSLVLRARVDDTTFPELNPARRDVQTGQTLLLAVIGDSAAVLATRGGDVRTTPRTFSRDSLPAHVGAAFRGASSHGVGQGLRGRPVIYAALPLASADWVLLREFEIAELSTRYRRAMLISESIIVALALSLGALIDHLVRAAAGRRERQLTAVRSDFVSSVSHELRTPLAQIRLFAELLRKHDLPRPEDADRALGIIEKEARRLTILVENILNVARLQRRADRAVASCDIANEIEQVAVAFAPLAAERGARVAWTAPPVRARVDANALRQILINFLENAVKYGPRDQTVRISAESIGRAVRIHVDDDGDGVPPDERESIWRAFYRREDASESDEPGFGIGLSVARDLALQYGGQAHVTDAPAPSRGARFTAEFAAA